MRFRKAFLSGAVLAAVGLVAATAVIADELPTFCYAGPWKITLTGAPSVGSCPAPALTSCPPPVSGSCVTATYKVEGPPGSKPDHVVGLMPLALDAVAPGNQVYCPGYGDPVLGLGLGDTSRKAFKVNPAADVSLYAVTLQGDTFSLGLVPVRVKKGNKGTAIEGACALAGPVVAEVSPNPYATLTPYVEEVLGGKCRVKVETDPQTGETTVSFLESMPGYNCRDFKRYEFGDVNISVTDQGGTPESLPLKFSEGLTFVAGTGTCAYKQYYPSTGPVYRICW